MERNTCYLNLSVMEVARTVSKLVERVGLSSRMVDYHELRQSEDLCGMVLLLEEYSPRMGSHLTLMAMLDNLEGYVRFYWIVTSGAEILWRSGGSKIAAGGYSEALRERLFSYLGGWRREGKNGGFVFCFPGTAGVRGNHSRDGDR